MERRKRRGINLTEGKRNIITALINEYDIKNAEDIQDALKDLLGGTIQEMLEAEMTQHLGYEPYERFESTSARNGRKVKTIHSKYWLGIFDNLKNRGVKDILILCTDGLSGMKAAVAVAFPKTEYQAPSEQIALKNLEKITEKWKKIYQGSMKS